ncbi:alpha-isopropylmalate synthase regulatory domain-containing protein, partial [Lysinibacillus sp. D4B1_S16]|uniref:alpha-isopropylmalate synthase regulatory domain-containing protein n=1 Tax=Lysinibacillus sp. D4B1_S16 TaxID=2941231 RepID=UPI0024BE1C7B
HEFEGISRYFLKLADAKKEVYDHDLYVIVESYYEKHDDSHKNATHYSDQFFDIEVLQVVSNTSFPSASVKVRKGNEVLKASAVGSGPIDALYSPIAEITKMDVKLV